MRTIIKLLRDKRGIGAIEYALVASLISVAGIVAFEGLGNQVENKYSKIDQALDGTL